jgi:hypothetical protein
LKQEGKANAELYRDDPEKREKHVRHRTPRKRLITVKGNEKPGLYANSAIDLKHNEVAREFISNGFIQTKAYASVYGLSLRSASCPASLLFNSAWFRSKLALMMFGVDGTLADLPKEYLLQKLVNVLEMDILDFVADDGTWLTVPQLRALPKEQRVMLDDFSMENVVRQVALRDEDNEIVLNDDGQPYTVEIRQQKVRLKMPSKHDYLVLLAKSMKWLETYINIQHSFIDGETMQAAEARIHKLRRNDIEGEAKRIATD